MNPDVSALADLITALPHDAAVRTLGGMDGFLRETLLNVIENHKREAALASRLRAAVSAALLRHQ